MCCEYAQYTYPFPILVCLILWVILTHQYINITTILIITIIYLSKVLVSFHPIWIIFPSFSKCLHLFESFPNARIRIQEILNSLFIINMVDDIIIINIIGSITVIIFIIILRSKNSFFPPDARIQTQGILNLGSYWSILLVSISPIIIIIHVHKRQNFHYYHMSMSPTQ